MTLKVFKPDEITDDVILSSTISEPFVNAATGYSEEVWIDKSTPELFHDTTDTTASSAILDLGTFKVVFCSNYYYIYDHATIADFTAYAWTSSSGNYTCHYYDETTGVIYIGGTFDEIIKISKSSPTVQTAYGSAVVSTVSTIGWIGKVGNTIYSIGSSVSPSEQDPVNYILKIGASTVTSYYATTGNFYSAIASGYILYAYGEYYIKKFDFPVFTGDTMEETTLVTMDGEYTDRIYSQFIIGDYTYGMTDVGVVKRETDAASFGTYIYSNDTLDAIAEDDGDIFFYSTQGAGSVSTSGATVSTRDAYEYSGGTAVGNSLTKIGDDIYLITQSGRIVTYSSGYNLGDEVIKTNTHRIYRCAADGTIDDPEVGELLDVPTWVDIGPTAKWAPFDAKSYTKTAGIDSTTFAYNFLMPEGAPTTIYATSLTNITSVKISLIDIDDVTLSTVTKDLTVDTIYDDDLLTNGDLTAYDVTFDDLYDPDVAKVKILFTGTPNTATVGSIAMGVTRTIGVLLAEANTDIKSYSEYETDDYGNITVTRYPNVKYTSFPLMIPQGNWKYADTILRNYVDEACVWVGTSAEGEVLSVYGYAERSGISRDSHKHGTTTIKVKGLV